MNTYISLAKLWMIAGRNILFAGPPGVGKTKLALDIAYSYQVISGYEGLTFRDLIIKYSVNEKGEIITEPGPLSKAVLEYYIGIYGKTPVHIVFDEINRVNIETLFGPVFTALDVAHRMKVGIIDFASFIGFKDSIIRKLEKDENNFEVARNRINDILDKCRKKGLSGIPLPYSTRILATMNTYDVIQLYKIGYALQRRFATIYIDDILEPPQPRIDERSLNEYINKLKNKGETKYNKYFKKDILDRFVKIALNELNIHKKIPSLVNYDYPTIIDLSEELDEIQHSVHDIKEEYNKAWDILRLVYYNANKIGLDLGISFVIDFLKLILVSKAISKIGFRSIISNNIMIDAMVSYILPQFHIMISRARLESILGNKSLTEKLFEFFEALEKILGEKSMTYKSIKALKRLLPSE